MTNVSVIGGGPAGAAASRLLASWGHQVRLITRPDSGDSRLAVSLPPSTAKLFAAIGVGDAIERAGFNRSSGNTVWWGSDAARVETFAGGERGWQVEVGRLADVLLECAVAAGAQVERATLSAADLDNAAFTLDCTGRSGLLARTKELRQYHEGPRTIALIGDWRTGARWSVPDDSHTVVESYDDGWMWSVPTAPGQRHVAAMIDPQRSELARGRSPRDVYLAEIEKTRRFTRLLADGTLQNGPWGFDASTYGACEYAGDRWLLVGDAGSFIDPLSSAGVKKALASGWLAAIVAHTCVTKPEMQPHALAFYNAREREIERHHLAVSRSFLTAAAHAHMHAFWADRAIDPGEGAEDTDAIRESFARIKAAETFSVRASPAAAIEPRPFIQGNEIALGPHIVLAGRPAGIRHLHAVDMIAVLELAPGISQVPDLFEAYVRRCGPVPLHDFLLALATAIARGLVVAE